MPGDQPRRRLQPDRCAQALRCDRTGRGHRQHHLDRGVPRHRADRPRSHSSIRGVQGRLRMLTCSAARALAADGVRVNSISPGFVATPMAAVHGGTEPLPPSLAPGTGGRFATPDEIACAVAYLLSDQAGYITGYRPVRRRRVPADMTPADPATRRCLRVRRSGASLAVGTWDELSKRHVPQRRRTNRRAATGRPPPSWSRCRWPKPTNCATSTSAGPLRPSAGFAPWRAGRRPRRLAGAADRPDRLASHERRSGRVAEVHRRRPRCRVRLPNTAVLRHSCDRRGPRRNGMESTTAPSTGSAG